MTRIEEILRATGNGLDVFRHELGPDLKLGRNFQNPFQRERQQTPSFNVYQDGPGPCRFKDFATGDTGDCFDLVRQLHGLSLLEALAYIERSLGLAVTTGEHPRPFSPVRLIPPPISVSAKVARPFKPVYRDLFTAAELAFWQQSGNGGDVLEKYGVRALESYTATRDDGSTYTVHATPANPLFAYDAGNGFYKVYAPLAEKRYKFTWPAGQPSGYVFGLAQLVEWQPLIVLAAGEKDAMTLSAHGYAAVTVGSETAAVPAALVAQLRERCDEVLVLYDADATGRKRAAEIGAEHQLRWVELPAELTPHGKDATDFYRTVYAQHLRPELLRDAIANAHAPAAKPKLGLPVPTMRLRTARQRLEDARNAPALVPLWGMLWESPGIAILAGEPGAGKSLAAVHVAHALSSATRELLGLACTANERVLYYDLELTDRQFERRFDGLPFTENLIIGEFNPDAPDVEFTFAEISANLAQTGAKLLIIDNITALALKTTADADASIAVMRGLKKLQIEQGVSSLILAHPPKVPDGVPLSLNHVGGSKHITNFADSVFFIARSAQGPNTRYLKQVKNRTGELLPAVLVCEITETGGHLGFALVGPDEERNHLAQVEGAAEKPGSESAADVARLRSLWLLNPTMPQAKLAVQVGRSGGWVNKHLNRLKAEETAAHVHSIHASPGPVNA